VNSRRRINAALIGLLLLVAGAWFVQHAVSGQPGPRPADRASMVSAQTRLPVRVLSELPPQAAQTWRLIQAGGPFPYRQDGVTFGNRERRLSPRPSGFYREYTVPTPGEDDRGARRLITGGSAELYYTADHYVSFVVVDPRR
jgi:guanyl-specific ribonuclease Sa